MLRLFLAVLLVCSTAYCALLPPVMFGSMIRDLYKAYPADFAMMATQWTINGSITNTTSISDCYQPYLGGFRVVDTQGSFQRTYTMLPIHNVVDFSVNVRMMDRHYSNEGDIFRLKIDNYYYETFINAMNGSIDYLCIGSDPDLNIIFSLPNIAHSSSTIALEIFWETQIPYTGGAFAIKDVVLSFRTSNSISTPPSNCIRGFYSNNGVCETCHSSCQDCFGPLSTQCFSCSLGYTVSDNECVKCPHACSLCSGPNEGQCLVCDEEYRLSINGTCKRDDCENSPYVILDNSASGLSYFMRVCAESCPSGEFELPNKTCASSCELPFQELTKNGTLVCGTNCNSANGEFLYPNGSCLQYCPYPNSYQDGYLYCDLPCHDYLYQNGSCLQTCPPPYAVQDSPLLPLVKTCNNTCPYGQYLYPNSTCANECPMSYSSRYEQTTYGPSIWFCSFPCASNEYLYQNSTCASTCRADFNETIDVNGNKLCNFPCYMTGGYLFDNGTCSWNCPYAFKYYENGLSYCRFPCASNQYYSNGRCTGSCESGSTPRIEGSFRSCESNTSNLRTDPPCANRNLFKYQNGSCFATCPPPLLSIWQGPYYYEQYAYCTYPCSPGTYLYPNTSCLPSCEPGFAPRFDGNMSFCEHKPIVSPLVSCSISSVNNVMTTNCSNADNTCLPGHFQYQNGSCLSSCIDPYYSILRNGSAYCNSPCASNEFLYSNGSCLPACIDDISISEGNFGFCDSTHHNSSNGVCAPGFFKYDNGSCLPTCHYPLSTTWKNDQGFCKSPCEPESYLFPNASCSYSCLSPWNIVIEGPVKFCKPPCPIGQFVWNNTCNSTCDLPGKPQLYNDVSYCYDTPTTDCLIYTHSPYGDGNIINRTTCYNPYNGCQNSEFEYEDKTCFYGCRYPNIAEIRNYSAFCVKDPYYTGPENTDCWPGQYKYPNGSCGYTCNAPFEISYQNSSSFCNPRCPSNLYHTDNGNCSSSCDERFIAIETPDYKYCKFPCYSGQYLYPNGSCDYGCPSSFSEVLNESFLFCNLQNESSCGTYEYNGEIRTNCTNPNNMCGYGRFQHEDNTCTDSCMYPYTPLIANSSAYCILNTSTSGCPPEQFMYYNGSCLPTCPSPWQANWNLSAGYCNSPCSYGAYLYENGSCSWSCDSPYTRIGDAPYLLCKAPCSAGEYYTTDGNCTTSCPSGTEPHVSLGVAYCIDECKIYAIGGPGSDYITNCTNPSTHCAAYQFMRNDGSCHDKCDSSSLHSVLNSSAYCIINNNSNNSTDPTIPTDNYCEILPGEYYDYANCTNPDNGCEPNEFKYVDDGDCNMWCLHPYTPVVSNHSAYCISNTTNPNNQTNQTNPTNPTNQTSNYCEIIQGPYYYSTSCTNLDNGCDQNQFKFSNGACLSICEFSQIPSVSNFSAYCALNTTTGNPNNQTNTTQPNNNTTTNGTVSLQLYIRYNMSLIDFNSQDGLNKFIQQLALILGVDPSDIIIVDVREGSTIIDSKIILTSASDDDSVTTGVSKAQTLSDKYSYAVDNRQLNIFDGVDVLGYKRNIQVNNPSAGSSSQIQVSDSSSGAIAIGVGVGLGILVVSVGGFLFYKRYRTRKDVESAKTEAYRVKENVSANDQEANDGSFVRIKKANETEFTKHQISIPYGLNLGQERDLYFEKNMEDNEKVEQEQEQQEKRVENEEKPIQLDAILNLDNVDINIAN